MRRLRDSCPCATCKTEREELVKNLLPILKPGQFLITSIVPVGQYAIQITWGDGHATGIYPFDLLRSLCECAECTVSIPSAVHS